jgi:hypothetical protein
MGASTLVANAGLLFQTHRLMLGSVEYCHLVEFRAACQCSER